MLRRAAIAPAIPVPCGCGRSPSADASKLRRDRAGKIGVRGIDLGIDDGDQNPVASRQPVRFRKIELLRSVLFGVDRHLVGLCQPEQKIRLRARSCWDPEERLEILAGAVSPSSMCRRCSVRLIRGKKVLWRRVILNARQSHRVL